MSHMIKALVCLGFGPGSAGWKAHTNPLSYCGTSYFVSDAFLVINLQDSEGVTGSSTHTKARQGRSVQVSVLT